jgi:GT2 family glycosyltransferase
MTARKDIAVILVGMNTRTFVKGFLDSLALTDWQGYTHEVIYVDNASKDDTLDMLRREYPAVNAIANEVNVGFTKAANQAARAANSRYHLQINNDTLVYPDSIAQLAKFLDGCPAAGMVGGRILNPDLTDQWSARRFPSAKNAIFNRRAALKGHFKQSKAVSEYLYKDQICGIKPFRVDWVPTVYSLIREEAFEKAGGMPEDLYYWAETVFCLRLREAGYETWTVPGSKIVHFEGNGGGARPYRVRKWHIVDFHRGAYRLFLEQHKPARLSPSRFAAATLLGARALVLLAMNKVGAMNKLGQTGRSA